MSTEERRETQDLIQAFEDASVSGNEVMDLVLNEKQNVCKDKGVTLACMVDGNALAFMKPVDVYAIIGNSLDNAIEAVLKCSDNDHRVISFTLRLRSGIACMQVENYFELPLQYSGNDLQSTKTDGGLHGYGIKSIRYVAENTEARGTYERTTIPLF